MKKLYTSYDNKILTRKLLKILRKAKLPNYVIESVYVQEYYSTAFRVYSRVAISQRAYRMIQSIWQHIIKEFNNTIIASMIKPRQIVNAITHTYYVKRCYMVSD